MSASSEQEILDYVRFNEWRVGLERSGKERPSFDYDVPPDAPTLRTVQCCATDLKLYPRAPELVPGWMKVELALAGAVGPGEGPVDGEPSLGADGASADGGVSERAAAAGCGAGGW